MKPIVNPLSNVQALMARLFVSISHGHGNVFVPSNEVRNYQRAYHDIYRK